MASENVIVTLRVKNKADKAEELDQWCRTNFIDTRQFEGCLWLHAYRKEGDPREVVMLEEWTSIPHYEKYLNWRKENGTLQELQNLLDGEPAIEYWSRKID